MKTKKQFIKQLLSSFLCIAMLLACAPFGVLTAFAENSETSSREQRVMHIANTLYYDANGGVGGPSNNFTGGITITVQKSQPTRDGYDFGGWNTKPDGTGESYNGGATYTFVEDNGNGGCKVTLYAQWIKAYDVYVGGVQIIETNKDDILGDGKASYNAETNTLKLNNAVISNGYEYLENCVAGIYADGDLNIELIGNENIVTATDSEKSSYGIRVLGDLNISGSGTITANGGEVTARDTYAKSVGIFADGMVYIAEANVNANGGNAVVIGEEIAYSGGLYADGGLVVERGGSLTAHGAKAQGVEAYSSGIEAIGSEDNYVNVSVYDGYLTAEGGEAVGTDYAGSAGIYVAYGGLYLYETKSNVVASVDKAVVTSEDQEQAYAYGNGIYIYAGDVDVTAGKLEVSGGSYVGINGDANAVYLQSEEGTDDDGNPYVVGGNFTVECDEVKPGLYSPTLVGTTVIINSPNGDAIHADGSIEISNKLFISLPENGKVSGVGGSDATDNPIKPDYWTILDSEGAEAQNVIIEPITYKVYIKGLSYDMAVPVPVGESVNKTYCELFEIDDFSESLDTTKEGYTFGGWYTDEAFTEGNEFGFNDPVNADITIYAKWVAVATDDDTDDDTENDANKPSDDTQPGNSTENDENKPTDSIQNETATEKDDNIPSDTTSPNTGDNSNIWLWLALLFVSSAGIFGITHIDRKRKAEVKDK